MTISIVPDNRPEANPARLHSGFSHPLFPHGPRVGDHQVYATLPAPARVRVVRHGWPCRCMWGADPSPRSKHCGYADMDILTASFLCDCGWNTTDRVYTTVVTRIHKHAICPNSVASDQNAA